MIELFDDTDTEYFMGIDPGYDTGAVCVVTDDLERIDIIEVTEGNTKEVSDFIKKYAPQTKFAVLEKVHSAPMQSAVASFNFGRGYGRLEALLRANEIPYEAIPPQKWMPIIGPREIAKVASNDISPAERTKLRAKEKTAIKRQTLDWCRRVFPQSGLTDSVSKENNKADSLAIAFYCWNHYRS